MKPFFVRLITRDRVFYNYFIAAILLILAPIGMFNSIRGLSLFGIMIWGLPFSAFTFAFSQLIHRYFLVKNIFDNGAIIDAEITSIYKIFWQYRRSPQSKINVSYQFEFIGVSYTHTVSFVYNFEDVEIYSEGMQVKAYVKNIKGKVQSMLSI